MIVGGNWKKLQCWSALSSLLSLSFGHYGRADLTVPSLQNESELKSNWQLIQTHLRVRTFTEVMAPAFQGNTNSVPHPDGSQFTPSSMFNIVWADYEIAPNLRIVYWQRLILMLNSNDRFQTLEYLPRDPRFALRWTQFVNNPNLTTSFDLFIQPNITTNQISNRNGVELGLRLSTSYSIPKSHWSMGFTQEFTSAYLGGEGPRTYGWTMPWVSYEISKTFSPQTYFTFPFQNKRAAHWTEYSWDDPGSAYIQNGIGVTVSEKVWVAFFLNNYIFTPPTLKNTWASMWVSLTFL